ncbi:MAG: AraC family transcriptional regulator [Gammaproteobacteria bacterium]|nr:AraC family transcriptional regulator [Gammaproteobacteria bacterium]MBU1776303.1 AraC family transcriptional regulator [Gammaproteobacteria bacterium]MBU1969394.1 AraC family transcriptional regulator [Gammaproteobacteria bacterium]
MPAPTQQLDDFLRRLHLGSEVYYVGQLCDAWHMSTPGGSDATTFHLVCHGEAWIHMKDGSEPARMAAGDIAFFPHDAAHTFSAHRVIPQQPFDYSHPAPLDVHAPGSGLLCGHLRLPAHIRRLLLASFPEFMLIRPDASPVGIQMRSLIEMMTIEATRNELGVTAILDRLSDALFLYVIRHALHVEPKLSPLLATLSDEHLRPAVTAFIDAPAEAWTVERMAGLACQSRSAFSERFTQLVRMPPMEFVATWRMQLASGMLADGNANMLDVAMKCGYESEAAFRKAFKRIIGIPPGKARGN